MFKVVAAGRMILLCTVILVYLILVGIPILLYCRLVNDPTVAIRYSKKLDHILLFIAGLSYEVEGLQKLSANRGYVYVGNHRSFADVAIAFLLFPGDIRFLAKKELFHIPLVSFALRTIGVIEVDRSNSEAAVKSIDRAVTELKNGCSMILFPEGTRNREEGVLPFKKGAFVLAIKAQVPIVPFTLLGTEKSIKPDEIYLYPAHVKVVIHEPMETVGMGLDDRSELLERAQSAIENTYLAYKNREKDSVLT